VWVPPVKQELATLFELTGNEEGWTPVLCPLHDDNNPSGSVNWEVGMFHCFAGCGSRTLNKLHEELFRMSEQTESTTSTESTEDLLAAIRESSGQKGASDFVESAQAYLQQLIKSRGIDMALYKEVGATPHLTPGDPLFGYLEFPFGEGRYVAKKFIPEMQGDRYLNTKGCKEFYGLDQLERTGDVILVEGIYDLLALRQLGFKNVVASLSSNFKEEHCYPLRGRTVFILFDSDYAGFKGTKNAVDHLVSVKANPIPLDMVEFSKELNDPNDALLAKPVEFADWIKNHISQYDSKDGNYIREVFLENRDALKYFSTGCPMYNNFLGGGYKEGFHVIAGKPAVGKSAFSAWVTTNMAHLAKARVLYCTYEISKRQVWSRIGSQFDPSTWEAIEMNPGKMGKQGKEALMSLAQNMRVVAGLTVTEIERAERTR
jgi:5S rRNA maturation endonuclease (ribonuclease M5)